MITNVSTRPHWIFDECGSSMRAVEGPAPIGILMVTGTALVGAVHRIVSPAATKKWHTIGVTWCRQKDDVSARYVCRLHVHMWPTIAKTSPTRVGVSVCGCVQGWPERCLNQQLWMIWVPALTNLDRSEWWDNEDGCFRIPNHVPTMWEIRIIVSRDHQ